MRSLGDLARRRLVAWMEANRKVTQAMIAKEVGVSQSWVSLYKSGDQDADIDQLDAMAKVFGHTLFELVDARPSPLENDLVEAYRRLSTGNRDLAIKMLQALGPPAPPVPVRKRTGER